MGSLPPKSTRSFADDSLYEKRQSFGHILMIIGLGIGAILTDWYASMQRVGCLGALPKSILAS